MIYRYLQLIVDICKYGLNAKTACHMYPRYAPFDSSNVPGTFGEFSTKSSGDTNIAILLHHLTQK